MTLRCWIMGHRWEPHELLEAWSEERERGVYPAVLTCVRCEAERLIEVPLELLLGDGLDLTGEGPWEVMFCSRCGSGPWGSQYMTGDPPWLCPACEER